MHKHFGEAKFFNQWHCAYIGKEEAAEHTYRLGQSLLLAKGKRWVTTAISLDVEKAFDSVWHDGIRYKLSALRLPIKLVRVLSSFLTERTIKVKMGDQISQSVSLGAGTHQGSVLSPLLYLIYANDLPIHPANKCDAGQFADDLSMWTAAKSKKQTYLRLQRALDVIEGTLKSQIRLFLRFSCSPHAKIVRELTCIALVGRVDRQVIRIDQI